MTKQSSQNNASLEHLKAKTGYGEFIFNFARRLMSEPTDITRTIAAMSERENKKVKRVEDWALRADFIGAATGFTKTQVEKDRENEVSSRVAGMSSEYADDLDNIRMFRPEENDEYLRKMIEADKSTDSVTEDNVIDSLQLIRNSIDNIAPTTLELSNLYGLNDFTEIEKLDDSNFTLAS